MVFLIWKNADKWYEKTKRKFTYNPNTQRKALWILCTCSSKLLIWGHLWKEEERKNRHPCMLLLRVNWWWPFGGKLCRVFGNLKKYVYFNAPILWFLLRVPWTARRSNQSILKEINPEYSLKRLMLKLKLQYFGHLIWRTDSLEKTLMLGKIEGGRRRGQQRLRWDGWMAPPTRWTWVWASSRSWWWTGKPSMLQSTGSQRVRRDWVIELKFGATILPLESDL